MKSKADFRMYDYEAPANQALKKKYNVRGIPTVLYCNAAGTEVNRTSAISSPEEFKAIITEFMNY